ncbi:MAG: hypothetical protein SPI30_04120 [Prevotella sp.]|nr:hypothetical protein [Prevotella sp.]
MQTPIHNWRRKTHDDMQPGAYGARTDKNIPPKQLLPSSGLIHALTLKGSNLPCQHSFSIYK